MPHFAQQGNSLQPAKTFFDALPLLLADDIALLPRGATINGAAASASKVLRHVRCPPNIPALAHEIRRVEALVAAHGHPPASRNFLQHSEQKNKTGLQRNPKTRIREDCRARIHRNVQNGV
jgi:transcriptional regulator with AAA-type ATPase domain